MSVVGTILGGLGIAAASKAASTVLNPVSTGVQNLISGGNWKQDGNTIAQNEFNAKQAELSREFNALEAEKNRQFQHEEAALNREYQTQMSNTAYQRAMQDMQKAGINPAMAFANNASGASTPSGAYGGGSAASGTAATAANAGRQHQENMGGLLTGVAAVANSLNNDRNKNTKMDFYQAMGMINTVARLFK